MTNAVTSSPNRHPQDLRWLKQLDGGTHRVARHVPPQWLFSERSLLEIFHSFFRKKTVRSGAFSHICSVCMRSNTVLSLRKNSRFSTICISLNAREKDAFSYSFLLSIYHSNISQYFFHFRKNCSVLWAHFPFKASGVEQCVYLYSV